MTGPRRVDVEPDDSVGSTGGARPNARKKTRVLFVHNARTRFVELDLELLRRRHDVTELCVRPTANPGHVLKQVIDHDAVFGWFASWHTFLPMLAARVFNRQSLLVIGGYDLANMPEIGYGHQRGGLKRLVSRWTIRAARCLVTNAAYSRQEASIHGGVPEDRVHVLYHGVPDPHGTFAEGPRSPIVLSVGNVDRSNLWRKGHEPFVRAAALLPQVPFVLVGDWKDDAIDRLKAIASPNVTFTGWIAESELIQYYRRASVYAQPSLHEGFGLSVAEAMLGGCIPVVTRAGALPEVVGPCGVYTDSDPRALAESILTAGSLPEEARRSARQRVLELFSMDKRARGLEELLFPCRTEVEA